MTDATPPQRGAHVCDEAAAPRIIQAFVWASHEAAPEFREYERLSTTVANAYLGPVLAFYISGITKVAT